MFSYYDSLENVLGNGFRPFRYRLEIKMPSYVEYDTGIFSNNIANTLVKATTLPGVRMQQRNFTTKGGHTVPIVGTKVFDQEWNATFYLDDKFQLRIAFEQWIGILDSFGSGIPRKKTSLMDSLKKSLGDALVGSDGIFGGARETVAKADPATTLGDVPIGDYIPKISYGTMYKPSDEKTNMYGEIKITPLDINDETEIYTYTLHNVHPIYLQSITLDDTMTANIGEFTCSFAFSHYSIESSKSLLDVVGGAVISGAKSLFGGNS